MILSLALHDCSYGYRRNNLVLDRLSLRFPAGITLLLGPNGAGKSTLLGISASALSPSRGSVNLDPKR
ncbi:ATP-binding cassette domain-containing protein [Sphaerisporangium sp. NPDC051017]|uniref:ATP-binding cassette domain-containing protein n=1 Tax=Sphaerisporangium sp. NPDC051017 TaxID=3154636 RepID=UPI00344296C0